MNELGTVYAVCRTVLSVGSVLWADRAYADQVPVSVLSTAVVRPYVVYSFAGGGDASKILQADPNLLIDVIAVADDLATAFDADKQIRDRLDDFGAMDQNRTIYGDAYWWVKTITRETRIHFIETVKGATQIYHSGGRYRWILEKRQ